MERVQLIHWKETEAEERASWLEAAGYAAAWRLAAGPRFLKQLSEDPPQAVLIDLTRLPSQGRDMALQLRRRVGTRHIPLVFVGGDPAKVNKVQELLPDAVYTAWDQIGEALARAIAEQPADPVVPDSAFAAYAGRPLAKKLGIKAKMKVSAACAPPQLETLLHPLPKGARLLPVEDGAVDLVLWFCRSAAELDDDMGQIVKLSAKSPVWIAWPKKASGVESDLTQAVVREKGLAAGMVDYKICSIDRTWSGLLFRLRG